MKRMLALTMLVLVSLLLIPSGVVLADQSYHTEHLPLTLTETGAAAGHTLRNGMVVNIHPNGPVNGAVEEYILNGAKPNTEYEVWWEVEGVGQLPTNVGNMPSPLVVLTDASGNGHYTYQISRAWQEAMGFTDIGITLRWLFIADGVTAFRTDSTNVYID